jgi:hypothetical protein
MKRETLMRKLRERYGEEIHCRTSEEFNGQTGGIWMSGENYEPSEKGLRVFDYYAEGKQYELGIHKKFMNFLEKRGWFVEWYDCGTVSLWPI